MKLSELLKEEKTANLSDNDLILIADYNQSTNKYESKAVKLIDLCSYLSGSILKAIQTSPIWTPDGGLVDLTQYITSQQLNNTLNNTLNNYIKTEEISKNLSGYANEAGFITSGEIPKDLSWYTNDTGFITSGKIPKNLSQYNNDAGFITEEKDPGIETLKNDVIEI